VISWESPGISIRYYRENNIPDFALGSQKSWSHVKTLEAAILYLVTTCKVGIRTKASNLNSVYFEAKRFFL